MIDRLEVSVEPEIPFTEGFADLYESIRRQPSKLYKEQVDLRRYGFHVRLYRFCRYNARHKIGFLQTMGLSLPEMGTEIEEIFECDSMQLRLSRIDLAVDVPVSIEWFRKHVRIPCKRCRKEIRGIFGKVGQGCTLYFGQGQDLVRIYDKQAELANRRLRGQGTKKNVLSNRCLNMEWSHGKVLTRVERQIRSSRIPVEIRTFGHLYSNLLDFNPFSSVLVMPGGTSDPDVKNYRLAVYLQGRGLRQLVTERGLAEAWAVVNSASNGNASRIFARTMDFLPPYPPAFEPPDLFSIYKNSLAIQLQRSPKTTESSIQLPACENTSSLPNRHQSIAISTPDEDGQV